MYDEAYRVQPDNIDLGDQAFFANVRTGNWKAAQQIATKLHKSFGQFQSNPAQAQVVVNALPDRYLYWSALAATFQADDLSTPEEMRPVLMKLAKKMLESAELPAHTTSDRFYAHLTVLLMMEQFEEAKKMFDSDEGKTVASISLNVDELRRAIVQRTEDFAAENERARHKIVEMQ